MEKIIENAIFLNMNLTDRELLALSLPGADVLQTFNFSRQ